MVLHLPRWATDCLKRADPSLAASTRPFALWEKQKSAMRLVELDLAASRLGLHVGQTLSDARAICPELDVREIDRGSIESIFADFGDWHSNASPLVSVLTDHAAYGDLCLDITGVSHLFGGEKAMLAFLTGRLSELGYTVIGAVAPSIGAAWALAHYKPGTIVDDNIADVLSPLPVAALRISEEQIGHLTMMGLKHVGQLLTRDRQSLAARFGASFIIRLDQALGRIEERFTPRVPIAERYAERRFAEPIGLIDDVLMTAHDLAVRLTEELKSAGLGAQSFHLFLYRVDHKVMTMSVSAARATRDPHHISRLFVHRAERLEGDYDSGFGIDMIRLGASAFTPIAETQLGAFEAADGAEDLDRLYDRVASRLGSAAVLRAKPVNSHIPELAVRLEPALERTPDDPQAILNIPRKRPLRLLLQPEMIEVFAAEVPDGPPPGMVWRRMRYRFVKAYGPERIGTEWWTLPQALLKLALPDEEPAEPDEIKSEKPKPKEPKYGWGAEDEPKKPEWVANDGVELTRDYFIVEDDSGRRFWVFREGQYARGVTQRWFMHGLFG
jgi:protein ImuB